MILSLRLPYVQNKLADYATKKLSQQLNTTISIDKVKVNFTDNANVTGIYVEDQAGDTLVYSRSLNVDIAFFQLFKNRIELEAIQLDGAVIKLKQDQDEEFNFQFIVDAFATQDTTTVEAESAFTIDIDDVAILDSRVSMELIGSEINIQAKEISSSINTLDLDNQVIGLNRVLFDELDVEMINDPVVSSSAVIVAPEETSAVAFPLASLPFAITCDALDIQESHFLIKESGATLTANFDSRYLDISEFTTSIIDIDTDSTQLQATINNGSFSFNEGVRIQNLRSDILFNNQQLFLENTRLETTKSSFDLSAKATFQDFADMTNLGQSLGFDINLNKSELHIADVQFFSPEVYEDPNMGDLIEKSVIAAGIIKGNLTRVKISRLSAELDQSTVKIDGTISNFMDTNKLALDDLSVEAQVKYETYRPFITDKTLQAQLREIGDINITSDLNGNMKSLDIETLNLGTDAILAADLSGHINNILDMEDIQYDLSINRIVSGNRDAQIFVDSLPEMLAKFDTIEYVGTLKGTKYAGDLTGGFATSLGDIATNFKIAFNPDYSDAQYDGLIGFDKFELGTLLDNDSLETITLQARLEGRGMDTKSIDTKIEAVVDQVIYNQYNYQNIVIDGQVKGLEFVGNARIDDENIRFQFDGEIDMNDSIPVMAFDFVLDTLNLAKLNLAEDKFQAKFRIDADFRGLTVDDADGTLTLYNLDLRKTDKVFQTDSIVMKALREGNERSITVLSEFLEADIKGDFQLALLPDIFLDFMDQYFPLKTFLGPTTQEDPILNNQEIRQVKNDQINASIRVHEIVEIAQFFDFPITSMDSTYLNFSLNAPENLTDFEFFMPSITYDGYFVDSIYATASNNNTQLKGELRIDSVSISEAMHISGVKTTARFTEKKAFIRAEILDSDDNLNLLIGTNITSTAQQMFEVMISDTFALNGKRWTVSQDSAILVSSSTLEVPTIQIKNNGESMRVRGSKDMIRLGFDQFDINNLTSLITVDSLDVAGIINGNVQIGLGTEIPIVGDLAINDIQFNAFDIGDLRLDAIKDGDDVDCKLELDGQEMKLKGQVDYAITSGQMKGNIAIGRINLKPFEPFAVAYAKDLSGFLNGNLRISGTTSTPLLEGKIQMTDVSAFIKPLSTKYKISSGVLDLSDGLIEPTMTMIDDAQRSAKLTGKITHEYFQDIQFDLNFRAQEFTFLNSKQSKKELFYGKFVGRVNARITGTPDLPFVNADIEALSGTDMTVQMLNSEAVLSQEKYIVFFDGSQVSTLEEIDSLANLAYNLENSVDLTLNLKATPAAIFHVIVDPITGDKLKIQGNTELQVSMPNRGDLSLVGDFTVTEGSYRVSYENTLKRTFDLDAGSQIQFQGDPTSAQLDMRALYNTKANTYTLLESMGTSITSDNSGSNRTDVQVVLNVGGTLVEPVLTFDIQVPTSSSSPVESSLTSALSTLRQNETQLLEQVFSLILFNSFTGGSSGGNISSMGSSQAISSVGNLINGQLSKLAGNAKGLQIDFQLDQYQDVTKESDANVTEFGLGVKQNLFNDRLIISVGGNANLETGESTTNNFSSFAGDFVIEYLLTEEGKYRVKVFQTTDYNTLSNDNVWNRGVGISYKAKYGRITPKKTEKKKDADAKN